MCKGLRRIRNKEQGGKEERHMEYEDRCKLGMIMHGEHMIGIVMNGGYREDTMIPITKNTLF